MQDSMGMARRVVRAWMRGVLEDKGWSANEWAKSAGTSPTNVTRMLGPSGSLPNVETLMKLARIAGSQPNLTGFGKVDAPPETERPNYCPECGHDLRPLIRRPRQAQKAADQ